MSNKFKVTSYVGKENKDYITNMSAENNRSESYIVDELITRSRLLIAKSATAIEGSKKILGKGDGK